MPDEVEQPEVDPEVDGALEPGGEQQVEGGEQEEPARQYVEVDDPDQRFVRVKVDGEEIEIPFSEAVRGYSRTEDYTRKTQELAQQREQVEFGLRLQQALEADPAGTLRILQDRYTQAPAPQPEIPTFDDPLEEKIWHLEQRLMQRDQVDNERQMDRRVEQVIGHLQSQFGASEEDIRAAIQVASEQNLPPEALPMVYKTMAFDRIQTQIQAYRQTESEKVAEEARRTAAKTAAAGTVTTGAGAAASGLTTTAGAGGSMSIRQAAEAAFSEHGVPELF